jgi:hypothetical protein
VPASLLFLLHATLAILLFFVTNWIGKHSVTLGYIEMSVFSKADEAPAFNFILRVLTPVVYLVIVAAIAYAAGFDAITHAMYLVVIYYFAFRLAFNLLTGRARLLNWRLQAVYVLTSCSSAWLAHKYLISGKANLLPDVSSMANHVWVVIIGFLYLLFNGIRGDRSAAERRHLGYLRHRYDLYKRKYSDLVTANAPDENTETLIYAVMIYEGFNRPKAYRLLERALFHLGLAKTLGIMQVKTSVSISDRQSIELGARILSHAYQSALATQIPSRASDYEQRWKEARARRQAVIIYNPSASYADEIQKLYDMITSEFRSKTTA